MLDISIIKRILNRFIRIITGHKGLYCSHGKNNHVSEGTILYEPCSIGSNNYFAPYTLAYNARIGNYCSIGPGCKIGLAEHDITAISTKANINNGGEEMNLFDFNNPSIIENDVWLGANVVVKQGIKVGTGAVIGANSVVISDIPPYAVAVGAPAKVKKYRFDNGKINEILKSKWFEKDVTAARRMVKDLSEQGN